MPHVITPPSPLALYSSLPTPREHRRQFLTTQKMYDHSETMIGRRSSDNSTPWFDFTNNSAQRHRQVLAPYHTPPDSVSNRSSGLVFEQSQGGQSMTIQSQAMPRAAAMQQARNHPPPLPQLPVPQPHVAYQPVSTVPAAEQVDLIPGKNSQDEAGNAAIAAYMQIPSSINNSRGSLSDFAAQITCLFWFESITNLQSVEGSTANIVSLAPLADNAKPTLGFRKWVTTMLSTTQVTQNVILLALMFIYRLKRQNPQVRGKPGSEYRLLTVALMLGNKFLDDNTYTNKTWADVSGISVGEIHIMEVEFLSNMRYNLYTSESEWEEWSQKLSRFYDYFEKASRPKLESRPELSPPSGPTLPAPQSTYMYHTTPASRKSSPPFQQSTYAIPRPQDSSSTMSGSAQLIPDVQTRPDSRKRSLDDSSSEPYPKKFRSSVAVSNGSGQMTPSNTPFRPDLPTPHLPPPTRSQQQSSQPQSNSLYHTTHLPPPHGRSMAMVYPPSTQPQHQTQLNIPHAVGPDVSRASIPPIIPMFERPQNGSSHPLLPMSGSPTNLSLTPTHHENLSPSVYPLNRSSPYRPVRNVHTLLVPPPSASLQAPSQSFGTNSMHYQPLGRPPSERRTGVVPYLHHERSPWSTTYHPQYTHAHP